ncbi:MAG: TonB-dependent receptor, partial [Acidobacteriaceae bacterium]|nr:TonB-dependent receptor [Acidobacteriaceae bacterium]
HNIKAGVEYRFVFDNGYDDFGSRPTVDFTAFGNSGGQIQIVNCPGACANDEILQTMAAALLGVPGIQSQTQFYNAAGVRTPTDFKQFVQREYGAFYQDQWKIRSNLTLSYGLRYQFDGVPYERNGNFSNLLYQQPSDPGPITFQTVGPGTGRQVFYSDPTNFEPRAGLAWDPFKDGKTSVRMGYGIFHDRVFGNLFENLRGDPPFVNPFQNFVQGAFLGGGPLVTLGSLAPPATQPAPSASVPEGSYVPAITILSRTLKNPYTQSWNVGIQRQLGTQTSIDVEYVGSGSHRLFRSVDGNPPLPWLVAAAHANGTLPIDVTGNGLRFAPLDNRPQVTGNTVFDEPVVVESVGNSTYNALQIGFNRQFSHGLQFQANYTWSHAIDDAGDPIVAPQDNRNIARNSFDLREERGNSDYDLRHRLILNWLYEVPFGHGHTYLNHGIGAMVFGGWEFSGLSNFQSGTPFSIYSSRDSEYTGLTNRPDLVGNPAIPAGAPRNETGPPISAFAVQPFGRPGNVGRNVFTGPSLYNTDATLIKNNRFGERPINLQFRAEVFNVFNRVDFQQPAGNTLSNPGTFGLSLATTTQPDGTTSARQIQLALKLIF